MSEEKTELRIVPLKYEKYTHYKIREDGVVFNKRGKTMKYGLASGKYPQVQLSNNKKTKYFMVSHLVAEHFMNDPPEQEGYEITYKNGDTTNCNVKNLVWRKRIDRPQRKSWAMKEQEPQEKEKEQQPQEKENHKRKIHPLFVIKPDRYIYKRKCSESWQFRIPSHNVSETFNTKEEAKQYRAIFFDIVSNSELVSKIYDAQKSN